MNLEVNLTKRVRTANGLRFCPVVMAGNGRVKPDMVLTKGKPERHPEGSYYLEWRNSGKRIRLSVGKDAAGADAQRQRKEYELRAPIHNVQVVVPEKNGHRSLASAVETYLEEIKLTKKPKTHSGYSVALSCFLESCHKPNLEDIDRMDLLKFIAFLRDEKEHAARTIAGKFNAVMIFLTAQDIRGLLRRNDRPKFTEEEAEIYEEKDLNKLLAACDKKERLWYRFFLMTGMRDQEVRHCYWSDVRFAANEVRVSHKPDMGWTPKMYKERTITIPDELVENLKEWQKKATCRLVFHTRAGKPKFDFLLSLKKVAERAKLDPDDFWLHKFRATFATRHLQNQVDIYTVMAWMGHSNMKSMLPYLRRSRSQKTLARVNDTFEGIGSTPQEE
jgi:integrase/recombinase XerD